MKSNHVSRSERLQQNSPRQVYLDEKGKLCVAYARKNWTKLAAIGDLEIRPVLKPTDFYRVFCKGNVWKDEHTSTEWVWVRQ